jgi:hypothetical protein
MEEAGEEQLEPFDQVAFADEKVLGQQVRQSPSLGRGRIELISKPQATLTTSQWGGVE